MYIVIHMNIYITPSNEEKLRIWHCENDDRAMSRLINELMEIYFRNEQRIVNSPADFVLTEHALDKWTLNFNMHDSIDDIVISSGLARELLRLQVEHKSKQLKPCTISEHTVTDDGKGCECGYFVKGVSSQPGEVGLARNTGAMGWTDGNVDVSKDGDKFMAIYRPTFINIQESPTGFGDTESEALISLVSAMGDLPLKQ